MNTGEQLQLLPDIHFVQANVNSNLLNRQHPAQRSSSELSAYQSLQEQNFRLITGVQLFNN
jgi:hypothetical protein